MGRTCKTINAKRKRCRKVEIFSKILVIYSAGVVLNIFSNTLSQLNLISPETNLNHMTAVIWTTVGITMLCACLRYNEEITLVNGARVLQGELKKSKKRLLLSSVVLCIIVFFGPQVLNSHVWVWVISRIWMCIVITNIYALYLSKACLRYFDRKRGIVNSDTLFFVKIFYTDK